VNASVEAHVTRTEAGRMRISHIDVELMPESDRPPGGEDARRLARCEELFEDFCTVTQSIRQGIPVHVRVAVPEDTMR
jgi:hypothetical protein